ncbi:unnamed protein product [Caenorhabditis nigoni]
MLRLSDCSSRCQVIYSAETGRYQLYVRKLLFGNTIRLKTSSYVKNSYDILSCFERAAYCLYGWEGDVLKYDWHIDSAVEARGWDKMDNDKHLWTFHRYHPIVQVGKDQKLQFRIDPERDVVGGSFSDVVGGPFQEMFLKSNA